MGACSGGGLGPQSSKLLKSRRASPNYGDEPVDFARAHNSRQRWRRSLRERSRVCGELLFEDGKALAAFFTFLRKASLPEKLLDAWLLSTSRFALEWSSEDFSACSTLAEALEENWDEYLTAHNGFASYQDKGKWMAVSTAADSEVGAVATSSTATGRSTVDEEHDMYEFTVAAMFGIHVAVACFTVMTNALASAVGQTGSRELAEIWSDTFPDVRLLRCLQNCCFRYTVPPDGTAYSPPTRELTKGRLKSSFTIEDICPELFGRFRHLLGVSNQVYYASVCRPDVEFIEFGSNSCSGEFFFFSHDSRFLLKTTTPREAEALMRMLPDLIRRFQVAPHSLLGKYVGLYRVFSEEMNYDRLFFVMMAATQHKWPTHHTYDLKGSTKGRKAKPGETVKKDLDFWRELGSLGLDEEVSVNLRAAHAQDLELLTRHSIMDYSLLLQVHDRQERQASARRHTRRTTTTLLRLGAKTPHVKSPWASRVSESFNTSSILDTIELEKSGLVENTSSSNTDLLYAAPLRANNDSSAGGYEMGFDRTPSLRCRSMSTVPEWRPGEGVWSADGRYLYSMSIIDMLVPFNWWYPKMQVIGQQVIHGGKADTCSRQKPEKYADRQVQMMRKMCRPVGGDHESEGTLDRELEELSDMGEQDDGDDVEEEVKIKPSIRGGKSPVAKLEGEEEEEDLEDYSDGEESEELIHRV